MKPTIILVCFIGLALLLNVGCRAMLLDTPAATNPLVTAGFVQTNLPNAQAYVQALAQLNAAANPTASQQPIAIVLTGVGTILAAFGGWYARHVTAQESIAATLRATQLKPTVPPTT